MYTSEDITLVSYKSGRWEYRFGLDPGRRVRIHHHKRPPTRALISLSPNTGIHGSAVNCRSMELYHICHYVCQEVEKEEPFVDYWEEECRNCGEMGQEQSG